MPWIDTATDMLRTLINDTETPQKYSDDRLGQMLLLSAILINQEISFDIRYIVDFSLSTIVPDPSNDTIYMNFMIVKAACQADFSTFRTKALMEGINARLGPASLTIAGNSKGFRDLLSLGPCAMYDTMRKDYMLGNGMLCRAILSPFIGNNFNPESLGIPMSQLNAGAGYGSSYDTASLDEQYT